MTLVVVLLRVDRLLLVDTWYFTRIVTLWGSASMRGEVVWHVELLGGIGGMVELRLSGFADGGLGGWRMVDGGVGWGGGGG